MAEETSHFQTTRKRALPPEIPLPEFPPSLPSVSSSSPAHAVASRKRLCGKTTVQAGGADDINKGAETVDKNVASSDAPVAKSPSVAAPVAKAPVAKAPVAKAPVAKAPVVIVKAPPITKAPPGVGPAPAKAPIAKAPITKASPVAKAALPRSSPAGSVQGSIDVDAADVSYVQAVIDPYLDGGEDFEGGAEMEGDQEEEEVEFVCESGMPMLRRRTATPRSSGSNSRSEAVSSQALRAAKLMSSANPPQKVLVVGDLRGRLDLLHAKINDLKMRGESVDFALAVGRFLSSANEPSQVADYCGSKPRREMPVPVYFIDSHSDVFISKSVAAERSLQIGPNLIFLGACGTYDIRGFRIAFLSGRYEEAVLKSCWGQGLFEGTKYTSQAIDQIRTQAKALLGPRERVDILLTSEWPHRSWSSSQKKQVPTLVSPDHSSPAVSDLLVKLKPHYHFYALDDRYFHQKASRPGNRLGSSTAVALAQARDTRLGEQADPLQKWCRVMHIRPHGKPKAKPKAKPTGTAVQDAQEQDLIAGNVFPAPRTPTVMQEAYQRRRASATSVSGHAAARPWGTSSGQLEVMVLDGPEVENLAVESTLPPPPPGWKLVFSSTYNKWYYHHHFSGKSSWHPPTIA